LSDIVVLDAGADGLVAAHALARGGNRVTLVGERRDDASGWLPPSVARELGVVTQASNEADPWLRAPLAGGGALELSRDMARSVESLRRISPRDAERWPRFCERMARLARLLEELYAGPPPSLVDLRFAWRLRRLGRAAMEEMMRLFPMPAAELLDDEFESDVLKGALATFAVRDLHQGPRSAGTAFVLLHHHVGNPPGVFRAPRSNLAPSLRGHSAIAVRQANAARITVKEGRVTGIALIDGTELRADIVVSTLSPRRTLDELVEPGWLDPDLARAVRHIRARTVGATLRLELERLADASALTLAPTVDYVERAYDDVKYGRVSAEPWLDVLIHGQSAKVHCQYAPHGTQVDAGAVCALLAPHLPPIAAVHAVDAHASDGQSLHAELALDQALWMRPLPELSGYRTPIEGLWLGGPAMHPGIAGLCGYNCAREVLRKA
jgi:phytoene dehydrogenase-like protein